VGTKRVLRAAIVIALAVPSGNGRADTAVFDESLTDGNCNGETQCTGSGGEYTAGGWRVNSDTSRLRLVVDESLHPDGLACGKAEVEFTNFNARALKGACGNCNAKDECYVNIIGIYEGQHGNNWTAQSQQETQLQVKAQCHACFFVPCSDQSWLEIDKRLKFQGVSWNWDNPSCIVNKYLPAPPDGIEWWSAGNIGNTYKAVIKWDCSGISYRLESSGGGTYSAAGNWTWAGDPKPPKPKLRHIFLGKDKSGGGQWIEGATFSRVRVWSQEPCDCGDAPDGGAQTDGGTRDAGADGGGPVVDSGEPDGGAQADSGEPDAGGPSDAGTDGDGGAAADSGAEADGGISNDAGMNEDAGGAADDAVGPGDAGVAKDSGASADPAGADAGPAAPAEETAGCGCSTLAI